MRLPAHVRAVDFVSDLHLCAAMPRTAAAFTRYLAQTPADALVLLGDVFEAWVGDDLLSQPFEAGITAALREAAQRMTIAVMPGNRDFLLGAAFHAAAGTQALADPSVIEAFGQRLLLTHGDALCVADVPYQRFRAQVREPAWQQAFLAQPLTDRLAQARGMRDASKAHQQGGADFVDADPALAAQWLSEAGVQVLIHGHTHRPGSGPFAGGQRHVLSDWDCDHAQRAEVLRWTAGGLVRLAP